MASQKVYHEAKEVVYEILMKITQDKGLNTEETLLLMNEIQTEIL
ncbi:hypothetical protein [Bacillus albus]|nr:hypothetical protein [Bacillus albus]